MDVCICIFLEREGIDWNCEAVRPDGAAHRSHGLRTHVWKRPNRIHRQQSERKCEHGEFCNGSGETVWNQRENGRVDKNGRAQPCVQDHKQGLKPFPARNPICDLFTLGEVGFVVLWSLCELSRSRRLSCVLRTLHTEIRGVETSSTSKTQRTSVVMRNRDRSKEVRVIW